MENFREVCALLLGCVIVASSSKAMEPEAALLLRLYRSDSSPAFAQRDLPRSGRAGEDELEGAARLEIGMRTEPRDDLHLKFSVMSAARWGSEDDSIIEAGESFAALENIAMMPLSVSAGRQAISWGRGLLFSDQYGEHLFDMAGGRWDTLPHRFDFIYADPALTVFDSPVNHLWLARWLYQAEGRSSVEMFGGAMSLENDGHAAIAGLRGVWAAGPAWETWAELAGEAGDRSSNRNLEALIADCGIIRRFSKGEIRTAWTWASGSDDEVHSFVPLFNGEHWGRLYDPPLSGIHIFTASASRDMTEALKISGEYFSYRQGDSGEPLGSEVDLSARCALSDAVSLELNGCVFFTDDGLRSMNDNTRTEIRLQLQAVF